MLGQVKLATKEYPKAIPSRMMTGILHDLKKQPEKANEHYQKILDINKNFAIA